MKVYELAKAVDPYVVSMRRYFHENPELSNQEDKTIERIGQELDAMGIRYEVVPKGGIIGYIEGTKPGKGKTVLRVPTAMRCLFWKRRTTWQVPVSAAPR